MYTAFSNITLLSGILFIIGFSLVIVEMFIPGFGIPGVTGGVLLILAIILTAKNASQAIVLITFVIIIIAIALGIVLYLMSKGKVKGIVLSEKQENKNGYVGPEDLDSLLGMEGTTLTVLRPSGIADFNGNKVDVVSDGEYLKKGIKVKIIKIQGRRVVVKSKE